MQKKKKLTELNPRWFYGKEGVRTGIRFVCPSCPAERTHSIIVPWAPPSPYRSGVTWTLHGEPSFESLTITPSVNCDSAPTFDPPGKWTEEEKAEIERTRCRFHGFITKGDVTW